MVELLSGILIIDDDSVDRDEIRRLLADFFDVGQIMEAGNADTARSYLQTLSFDCIIVDYRLPTTSGIELVKHLLKPNSPPFVGIVLLTGEGSEDVAVTALKAGVHDYLIKDDLTAAQLYRAVRNAANAARDARRDFHRQQALEHFASMVSDELKQPLKSLQSFLGLMQENVRDGRQAADVSQIRLCQDSAGNMVKLVENLMTLARTGQSTEPLESHPLRSIVEDVLSNLTDTIQRKNGSIDIGNLPEMAVRPAEFRSLFHNLIENALTYNDDVTPTVRVHAESLGTQYLIKVEDNGIGIPTEKLGRLFKPGGGAGGASGGVAVGLGGNGFGLGLSICAKIVDRYGGRIWCTSTQGEGSTIHITLPQKSADPT